MTRIRRTSTTLRWGWTAMVFAACVDLPSIKELNPQVDTSTSQDTGNDTGDTASAETDSDSETESDTADTASEQKAVSCTEADQASVCGEAPCVDGYCCDATCDGPCESCGLDQTEGVCTPIPAGDVPKTPCTENMCIGEIRCDGNGGCDNGKPLPDFTLCEVTTIPDDRAYDICVSGVCVSPGCGDLSCNTPGPHFPLPDTGQRNCYDEVGVISCGEESGYPGQDGDYGWDTNHPTAERYNLTTDNAEGDLLILDNVTGLTWQGCAGGIEGGICDSGSPKYFTWGKALTYCDRLEWGEVTDWRLPDIYELLSIVNREKFDPAVDDVDFPGNPASYFWTATMDAYGEDEYHLPIAVCFACGDSYQFDVQTEFSVRCVSGDPTPREARFSINDSYPHQETVVDALNQLEWQRPCDPDAGMCDDDLDAGTPDAGAYDAGDGGIDDAQQPEAQSWRGALSYCQNLTWAGHENWRLPNINELISIVDNRQSGESIPREFLPISSDTFWSATTFFGYQDSAWWIDYTAGGVVSNSWKTETRIPRCVRDISQ